MNKIIITVIIFITGLFFIYQAILYTNSGLANGKPNVVINSKIIKVEIADDLERQITGLSNRRYLIENEGMLFIFNNSQNRTFWMKNMLFPIDIIWIKDRTVVKIDKNLPPEGARPSITYNSGSPVNYILEVNTGLADKYNIKIGDIVNFNF